MPFSIVPQSSYYHHVDIKDIFINQVSIKDNTLAIIPTLSSFGLDGNHFGSRKPPANTYKRQVFSPPLTSWENG